jgi:CoA:oxalate CoA-transferase
VRNQSATLCRWSPQIVRSGNNDCSQYEESIQMSLAGNRVVDLTRIISGPFCTQLLADLGADVIKVETPTGDPMREQGTTIDGLSWYFAGFNRNKRSIALDLRNPAGMEVLRDMIRGCDVLVENFKAGTLTKMGLPDEVLEELNPRLVVCHISGFGSSGPYADRPAFDFIAQAMSGFMDTNGYDGDEPLRSGLPISDLVAGLYASLAIAASLAVPADQRAFNSIDVCLTDSLASLLAYMASEALATGTPPTRSGNDHPLVTPYGLFHTKDGYIAVAPSNDGIYVRLLDALDRKDLLTDPRFDTNSKRMANRPGIRAELEPHFRSRTTAEWIDLLNEKGVPAGPVLSVNEALEDPQLRHREMIIEVPHPGHGNVRMLGFPIKQSVHSPQIRYPVPDLGQHGAEILRELGFPVERVRELVRCGAIHAVAEHPASRDCSSASI